MINSNLVKNTLHICIWNGVNILLWEYYFVSVMIEFKRNNVIFIFLMVFWIVLDQKISTNWLTNGPVLRPEESRPSLADQICPPAKPIFHWSHWVMGLINSVTSPEITSLRRKPLQWQWWTIIQLTTIQLHVIG